MQYLYDKKFADVFRCNDQSDWHDYYYISPYPMVEESLLYCVNRTGMVHATPSIFEVERTVDTKFCQLICILSGKGQLQYQGKSYYLDKNQLVLLNSGEPHAYRSLTKSPMGLLWLEFYGGDSRRIMSQLIKDNTPIIEGEIFRQTCNAIGNLQQGLMVDTTHEASVEIYGILHGILSYKQVKSRILQQNFQQEFQLVNAYIDVHMGEEIQNKQLAKLCKVSPQYFMKRFKEAYHTTPHEYVMKQRVNKSKYLLTQTDLSLEEIVEQVGFCNPGHFIRRFKAQEKVTPANYRKQYRMY